MKAKEYLKEFTREELELHISILEAEIKEAREKNKQANKFIKDMAEAIGMDVYWLSHDEVQISIYDVEKHLADMGWVVKQSNKEEQT